MKIIALAVAAVATGANASNIYDNGQTSLNLKGEIDAYLSTSEIKDSASDDVKTDPDADVWAKIQIDANHKLTDTVTVFGSFEMQNGVDFNAVDDNNDDSDVIKTDDLYVGAQFGDNFGFAVGEVGDFGDSLNAIIIDNTNEGTGYVDDTADKFESKSHAVSLKYNTDSLTLIADTYLAEDEDKDSVYGVSVSYDVAGFNIGASYQDRGNRESFKAVNTGDNDVYGIKLGYGNDAFSIASHYVVEQIDSVDYEVIGLAADYTIDDLRLYASAYSAEEDNNSDDLTAYTLGVDYAFSKDLTGFVEYTAQDNYNYENDADYSLALAGVYFSF